MHVSLHCCLGWADLWSSWIMSSSNASLPQGLRCLCWHFSPKSCDYYDWLNDFASFFLLFFLLCGGRLPAVSQLNFCMLFLFFPCVKLRPSYSCASQSQALLAGSWRLGRGSELWPWGERATAQHSSSPAFGCGSTGMALTKALCRIAVC